MATATVNSTAITVSGTPFDFLPLPTPWPSGQGCSDYIYRQLDGTFLAWDPYYGLSLASSARTCLPPQVTSWWFQTQTAATSTLLGPTFVCPAAYSAVQTVLVASSNQKILCCPSHYSLYVPQPDSSAFPSQCTSTFTPGQTVSYLGAIAPSGYVEFSETTTTVQSETATIYGVPVNGYNFVAATATTAAGSSVSSTLGSTGLAPSSSPPRPSSSPSSSSTSQPKSGSSAPSLGVSVGVSVGVVLGVLGLCIGAFMVWRRRRRRIGHSRDVWEAQDWAVHHEETDLKADSFGRVIVRQELGTNDEVMFELPDHTPHEGEHLSRHR